MNKFDYIETCECGKSPKWFNCMCRYTESDRLLVAEEEARRNLRNDAYLMLVKIQESESFRKVTDAKIQVILSAKSVYKKIFWVTINPKPDVDLEKFLALINNYMKRPFIIKGRYVLEQTGETIETMGKHPHVHILFEKLQSLSPKQCHDRTYSTFNTICGNKKCVDIRVYDASLMEEKVQYMKGEKWDSSKDPAILINPIWRDKFKLT